MPRPRKAAGLAVDRRNGQQVSLPSGGGLRRFSLPRRLDGEVYDLRTRRMWASLWADPVSSALSPVDRELVVRWAVSVDDWVKAMARAYAGPVVTGSTGQDVRSPWFVIAGDAMGRVVACEAQMGVGALNRARLGIAITSAAIGLDEVNRRFAEGGGGEDEPDPRLG